MSKRKSPRYEFMPGSYSGNDCCLLYTIYDKLFAEPAPIAECADPLYAQRIVKALNAYDGRDA